MDSHRGIEYAGRPNCSSVNMIKDVYKRQAQDSDLGLEIQGKLENVLQGGGEDLSFVKALTALNSERGKIKTPRSTRARLDIVQERIVELEVELAEAREREAGAVSYTHLDVYKRQQGALSLWTLGMKGKEVFAL